MRQTFITLFIAIFIILSLTEGNTFRAANSFDRGINKEYAIRSILLTKVLEITDDSGDFLFKKIENIKIAPDNSVFIQGHEKLLQFDSNGKYLRNYFVKGQGPGELRGLSTFYFLKDTVVMVGFMPFTILKKNFQDGSFKE